MSRTDAVVHLQLASGYGQVSTPGHISEGLLFRVEAITALVVALVVVILGNRAAFAVAFVVTASAFAVVVAYRCVNIPAFGPIPSMYEPLWFAKRPSPPKAQAQAQAQAQYSARSGSPTSGTMGTTADAAAPGTPQFQRSGAPALRRGPNKSPAPGGRPRSCTTTSVHPGAAHDLQPRGARLHC